MEHSTLNSPQEPTQVTIFEENQQAQSAPPRAKPRRTRAPSTKGKAQEAAAVEVSAPQASVEFTPSHVEFGAEQEARSERLLPPPVIVPLISQINHPNHQQPAAGNRRSRDRDSRDREPVREQGQNQGREQSREYQNREGQGREAGHHQNRDGQSREGQNREGGHHQNRDGQGREGGQHQNREGQGRDGQNREGGQHQNREGGRDGRGFGARNEFRKRDRQGRDTNNRFGGGGRFRDRFEMSDDEDGDNLTIDIDWNDPRVVRIAELQRMNADQLQQFAQSAGVELSSSSLTKSQIVFEVVKTLAQNPDEIIVGEGTMEILPDGYGFLRSPIYNYLSSTEDIYISPTQVRRLDLRRGDTVVGTLRSPKEKEKYFALAKVESINGFAPAELRQRKLFENLTPLYPQKRLVMETEKSKSTGRVIDLAAPIGMGQRGIIVAPPRAGKTIILQEIAAAIAANNPQAKLIVLLIDERPEEVTDMTRTIKGEVIASTFDELPERHVQVVEMVIERARRLVECGIDVIILLDSLTRLARAYNTVQPHSGKILSGGVDANALHKPKRLFGAARNIEEGGSLTIIATALIETGSRMDEVIFEEFKGTGNMEIVLDRRLADRRVWPAIDLIRSGTRKEDLLYHPSELEKIYLFRQAIADLSPLDAMNLLLSRMKKTNSNIEFLLSLKD